MIRLSARQVRRWPAQLVLSTSILLPLTPRGPGTPTVAALAAARVTIDRQHDALIVELPPVDLPASTSDNETMVVPPAYQAVIPASVSICKVDIEIIDGAGHILPHTLLHHVNLTDPSRRDLFVPTSLHILAASKETPSLTIPRLLMGLPLERGQRLLVTSMLANPTSTAYHDVRVRVVLGYAPLGQVFPVFRVFPWVMDAMFPVGKPPNGSKAFDLPPGRSSQSWEASPAIPGYIVGCGGHVHDYAVGLKLEDATTGRVLWHQAAIQDSAGHVLSVPVARFYRWYRLGIHIVPAHRYRMTVTYDNPTPHVLPDAGMGAIAGLFIPDRGVAWPQIDTANAIYQQDFTDTVTPVDPSDMVMHGSH